MAAKEVDGNLIEALNVAGFMMNATRTYNGKLKFQFIAGTYRGQRNVIVGRSNNYGIESIPGLEELQLNIPHLIKLAEVWLSYRKQNFPFFRGLNELIAEPADFQRVAGYVGLTDESEVMDHLATTVIEGGIYVRTKFQKAKAMIQSFKKNSLV